MKCKGCKYLGELLTQKEFPNAWDARRCMLHNCATSKNSIGCKWNNTECDWTDNTVNEYGQIPVQETIVFWKGSNYKTIECRLAYYHGYWFVGGTINMSEWGTGSPASVFGTAYETRDAAIQAFLQGGLQSAKNGGKQSEIDLFKSLMLDNRQLTLF